MELAILGFQESFFLQTEGKMVNFDYGNFRSRMTITSKRPTLIKKIYVSGKCYLHFHNGVMTKVIIASNDGYCLFSLDSLQLSLREVVIYTAVIYTEKLGNL